MQPEILVSLTSLIGVGLGGALSYLAQLTTQRHTHRREAALQARELAERRRAERLDVLRQFIEATQQAERAAGDKDDSAAWRTAAEEAMDRVWVYERMIFLLFGAALGDRAHAYARALNRALDRTVTEASRWDFVEPLREPKVAFLAAAHEELG
jgi:hypothetical protein